MFNLIIEFITTHSIFCVNQFWCTQFVRQPFIHIHNLLEYQKSTTTFTPSGFILSVRVSNILFGLWVRTTHSFTSPTLRFHTDYSLRPNVASVPDKSTAKVPILVGTCFSDGCFRGVTMSCNVNYACPDDALVMFVVLPSARQHKPRGRRMSVW